jgi:hypothetical protein
VTFACDSGGVSVAIPSVSVGGAEGWVLTIDGTDDWVLTAGVIVERLQAKARMDRLTITNGIRFISPLFDTIIGSFIATTHSQFQVFVSKITFEVNPVDPDSSPSVN